MRISDWSSDVGSSDLDIANAQGGMERIKNTPLPNGFRFFPNLFTRVFCVLLPIALVESLGLATPIGSTLIGLVFLAVLSIGEDLTDPFANSVHDVPLTAMCRTIEIDLLQTAGLPAPEPLTPDHGVLWGGRCAPCGTCLARRSAEHTSELQSLMRNSSAGFCLKT